MKRTLSLIFIPIAVSAQQTLIKGKLPELAGHVVFLENVNHYKEPINIDEKGNFAFNDKLDSGYYSIDKDVYLFLGPDMNLSLNGKLNQLQIQGTGQNENLAFNEINSLINKFFPLDENLHLDKKFNTVEPNDFLSLINYFKSEAKSVLNKAGLGNKFIRTQTDHINYAAKFFINDYIKRYGIDTEKEVEYYKLAETIKPGSDLTEVLIPAVKAMHLKRLSSEKTAEMQALIWEDFDINNSDLYSFSSYYRSLLYNRIESLRTAELIRSPYLKNKSPYELRRDIVKREFDYGPIREDLLFQNTINLINGGLNDEKIVSEYLNAARDKVYHEEVLRKFEKLKLVAPGNEAPSFNYKDQYNRTVTLSDFKGSYVYLNIWASWCAPCKMEVPYLKQIEKKYQNQNIRFVNISVDLQSQRDKWLQVVKEQYPSGVHLLSDKDFRSDFIKAFCINTIPRFILIDPEGRIVNSNAPRPSNPKLQETLDKLLITNLSTCATCAP